MKGVQCMAKCSSKCANAMKEEECRTCYESNCDSAYYHCPTQGRAKCSFAVGGKAVSATIERLCEVECRSLLDDSCSKCIKAHQHCEVECDSHISVYCIEWGALDTPRFCEPYSNCANRLCEKEEAKPCSSNCVLFEYPTPDDSDEPEDSNDLEEPDWSDIPRNPDLTIYGIFELQCFTDRLLLKPGGQCTTKYRFCNKCATQKARSCMNDCRCGHSQFYKYPNNNKISANKDCTGQVCEGCADYRDCMLPCSGDFFDFCSKSCAGCVGDVTPGEGGCHKDCSLCGAYTHCEFSGGRQCYGDGYDACKVSKACEAANPPSELKCDECDSYSHCSNNPCEMGYAKSCMAGCACGPENQYLSEPADRDRDRDMDDDKMDPFREISRRTDARFPGANPDCGGRYCVGCEVDYVRQCMIRMFYYFIYSFEPCKSIPQSQ